MDRKAAKKRVEDHLYNYGLLQRGWTYKTSKNPRVLGECNYTRKTITLSIPMIDGSTPEQVEATIIHEIAHALTPESGHGKRWRNTVIAMGGKPERCTDTSDRDIVAKWDVFCPNHGKVAIRSRKVSKTMMCSDCKAIVTYRPNPNYKP